MDERFGFGLITLIRNKMTFTITDIPRTINQHNTELHLVRLHINSTKHILQSQTYTSLIETTHRHNTIDKDITNSVLTGDINVHSTLWQTSLSDITTCPAHYTIEHPIQQNSHQNKNLNFLQHRQTFTNSI